ncbi:hypothetical protein [Cellulosimicrobium sp. CUA-896]|uniref:hypothetical protein n=1 Tax=Cellulosimicrobium sp. CUA-896 TaxID=1517881 RepID=UPI0011154140|nr:hypothetical protein [Cellulosimicrobium sp. CUA-896]
MTILVDDHGAPARQKAAVTGLEEQYAAGDEVVLEATVEPVSVLDRWEWYLQRPGTDTPALLEDTLTSRLTFEAAEELDGAALFARLTFDDGRAYVESPPVVLSVVPGPIPSPSPSRAIRAPSPRIREPPRSPSQSRPTPARTRTRRPRTRAPPRRRSRPIRARTRPARSPTVPPPGGRRRTSTGRRRVAWTSRRAPRARARSSR